MIDLGANIGSYTVKYAETVGPTGHVLAVEPDPENVKQFRDKCSRFRQVDIAECAVFSHSLGVELFRDDGDPKRDSCWAENRLAEGPSFTVPTTTLDALACRVPRLKAIKMDVQGAECHVLDGASETLQRDLIWAVELWPMGLMHAGRSVQELADMFQAHGFSIIDNKWREWADLIHVIQDWTGHRSTDVILKRLPGND